MSPEPPVSTNSTIVQLFAEVDDHAIKAQLVRAGADRTGLALRHRIAIDDIWKTFTGQRADCVGDFQMHMRFARVGASS